MARYKINNGKKELVHQTQSVEVMKKRAKQKAAQVPLTSSKQNQIMEKQAHEYND